MSGQRFGDAQTIVRPALYTFLSEVASLLATVWITRRIAQNFPATEVGRYLVLRQVLGWVLGAGFLGLNVSLPRALARARVEHRRQIASAALTLVMPLLAVLALVATLSPGPLALLFLADAKAAPLLAAACLLFGANGLFALTAAALQGLDRFGTLALVRVAAFALGPLLVVEIWGAHSSLPSLLRVWATVTLGIDALTAALLVRPLGSFASPAPALLPECRRLLFYGGPRMITALCQLAVTSLSPSLALWSGASTSEAATLSVAAMFGTLLGPLRLALQPIGLRALAAAPNAEHARALAKRLLHVSIAVSGTSTLFVMATGGRLATLWLGPALLGSGNETLLRIALLATGFQFFCYSLEGVLDADDRAQRRPRAQFAAACIFAAIATYSVARHRSARGLCVAQLASGAAQAWLYLRLVRARYDASATLLREQQHRA